MIAELTKGEFWDVGSDEYYADQALTVSHSDKEVFRDSPARYEAMFITKTLKRRTSDEMVFGNVFHGLCLEGELRAELIPAAVLSASGQRRGKKWDEFEAANDGKVLYTEAEIKVLYDMRSAVRKHDKGGEILFNMDGRVEQPIRWTDLATGLACRCKLDKLCLEDGIVADIKTSADGSPKAFSGMAYERGYHRQAAFYLDAVRAVTGQEFAFVFIVVEKSPPYIVESYTLTEEFIQLGRDENKADLQQFARCKKSGIWQRELHGQILQIGPPRWSKFEKEWSQ